MLENEETPADQSKPFQTQTKNNELFFEITKNLKEFEINSFNDIASLAKILIRILNYKQNGLLNFEKMTPNMQGITVGLCADSSKLMRLKQRLQVPINDLRNFLQSFVKKIKKSEDSTVIQRNKEVLKILYKSYKEILLLQKGKGL